MEHMTNQGIIIVGLGPGNPDQLTRQALQCLESIKEIYLRTQQHPAVAGFPKELKIHSFDEFYESSDSFDAVYEKIVARVLELGSRTEGVVYAVPGHPYVAEATSPEIIRQARAVGLPVRVIDGLSFLEPTMTALALDPFPQMNLADALEISTANHPAFSPAVPTLIAQIYSRSVAADVKLTLMNVYPDDHPVRLVHAAGTEQELVEALELYEIDRSPHLGLLSSLYLPPLAPDASFESFQEVIAHLRAPDGCPWDKEQTHLLLRNNLLEETYEVLAALDAEDPDGMREEFGDLMLQVVLHAQIATEEGEFTMEQVLEGINRKLVRRHPHVFGEVAVNGVSDVLTNWEKIKDTERKQKGTNEVKGLLDGVPSSLPALAQAQAIQDRAARVGFDWAEIKPVIEKVKEELEEVFSAESEKARAEELGDLLFAVVNLVRWHKVDAESALRETNAKFRRRFAHVEKRARETGRSLNDMTLAEMDVFWDEAKEQETGK
jgi:tetrapyrrole methylase family protein / MazG family protein